MNDKEMLKEIKIMNIWLQCLCGIIGNSQKHPISDFTQELIKQAEKARKNLNNRKEENGSN